MKLNLLVVVLVFFVFPSCGSMSSFDSPNNFRNLPGVLYLANGKEVEGKLLVQTGNVFGSDVRIYADDDKKPMHFKLGEVKGFRIRNDYYALKEKKGGISLGKNLSFMKRLTPEESRIHLYEDVEKETGTDKAKGYNSSASLYKTEYFLELPKEEGAAVYPLGGSFFVPDFDEKMSRIVSDCPTLAQKIATKEAGYFYAQVSLFKEKRVDILMNIIQEYNRCSNK